MLMKKVGILYHPMVEMAYTLAQEIEKLLDSRGISVWLCSAWEGEKARAQLNNTDLIVTTGGDGTILRAAQVALTNQTPITGVNLGKLGFMTELKVDEVDKLADLLEGKGWIDERAMLEADVLPADKTQEPSQTFYALNDVVVARGAIARLVSIDASIDNEHLTTYRADGVILATATGSTGYSLAVGGPILHPPAEELLLVPIAHHLGLASSMILPSTATVKLRLTTTHQATLSIDGHINLPLSSGATITVRRSSSTTRFLRTHPRTSFYHSLEQRLKGRK